MPTQACLLSISTKYRHGSEWRLNTRNVFLKNANHQKDFERFRELVLADRALHDQLRAAPDEPAFIELAVRLAAERRCSLSAPVLQDAIIQKRRAWLERWL